MKFKFLFLATAALAVLLSCGSSTEKHSEPPAAKPIAVQTVTAVAQEWPVQYEATGTVRARVTALIASRMTGSVEEVRVHLGDHVSTGQTLVTLDARDLELGVRKANALNAEAVSMLRELESAIAAAKANLDLAEVTAKRMDNLFATKSISPQEHDEAQARLKSAQANYQMAQARRAQVQSRIDQTEEGEKSSVVNRDYSRIVAPFAGIVTEKTVEPGSLATAGTPLLTLEKDGPMRLEAIIDESRLPSQRVGQKVSYKIDVTGCEGVGTVDEIVPVVDPASRSYLAKINLPCAGLRAGMFGRAFFATGSKKTLAVPSTAVVSRGQLQSVFVVEGGMAHSRLVTLGEQKDGLTEVLSGLNPGDTVVTAAPPGLVDGSAVEVGR